MIESPVAVDVYYDFHCPYCYRAIEWLDQLGADRVQPTYRLFALEQVNRDADAAEWRLWEQPLDYEHHRGRQDRRPLAPFLAIAHLQAVEPDDVVARFRLAVFASRFDEHEDITDVDRLVRIATDVGADGERLRERFADPTADVAARVRIASDWTEARREFLIFGVPTLRLSGVPRPFYLRLEQRLTEADGETFWARLTAIAVDAPYLLELKAAERRTED